MSQQNKIFIGNLPFNVDENNLRERFEEFGEIQDIAIPKNRETGRSKGFAFITFKVSESAQRSLSLNQTEFGERKMTVNMALEDNKDRRRGRESGSGGRGNSNGSGYGKRSY